MARKHIKISPFWPKSEKIQQIFVTRIEQGICFLSVSAIFMIVRLETDIDLALRSCLSDKLFSQLNGLCNTKIEKKWNFSKLLWVPQISFELERTI